MPQTTFSRHMKLVSNGRRCNSSRTETRESKRQPTNDGRRRQPKCSGEREGIVMTPNENKKYNYSADQKGFLYFYVPLSENENKGTPKQLSINQSDDASSTQSFFSTHQDEASIVKDSPEMNTLLSIENTNEFTKFSDQNLQSALAMLNDTNERNHQDSVCSSIQQGSLNNAAANSENFVSRFNSSICSPSLASTSVTTTPTSILTPSQSYTQELDQTGWKDTYSVPLSSAPSRGFEQKKVLQRIESGSSMASTNWGQFVDVAHVEEELEKYSRILNRSPSIKT